MIHIDGTHGEGGGQIVRTALALSTLTGQPFRVSGIRAGRSKPGLKAQHLTAVHALEKICDARVEGAAIGATEMTCRPGKTKPGEYLIDIGTAGSIALLLQALLLPLAFGRHPSRLTITGGTCGKWQAPVEYLQLTLLPYLQRISGIEIERLQLGYFPKGGGKVRVDIQPFLEDWQQAGGQTVIDLSKKGKLLHIEGNSHASELLQKAGVAERQAEAARHLLADLSVPLRISKDYQSTYSSGSGITLSAVFQHASSDSIYALGTDALGERGIPAEKVGRQAAQRLLQAIHSEAPVDEHLTDQLIPLLALLPGSRMRIPHPSNHLLSNMYVVEQFLPVRFKMKGSILRVEELSDAG